MCELEVMIRKSECFGLESKSALLLLLLMKLIGVTFGCLLGECVVSTDPVGVVAVVSLRHLICGLGWPPARQLIITCEFRMAELDLGASMK